MLSKKEDFTIMNNTINNAIFSEPIASELEDVRRTVRSDCRLTYDCMKGVVKGDKVICTKGHFQSMNLLNVICGDSNKACQTCEDYDGEEI
jgi:hypothetical protein